MSLNYWCNSFNLYKFAPLLLITMKQISDLTSNVLFETEKGYTYQCDTTDSIVVNFVDTVSSYKVQDFLIFQRKVNSVDIMNMLYDLSDQSDAQLIETTKKNFSRNLTICEIVQLRELLNGTKFTLSLNSMLCDVLIANLA
ncbi:hypothetical protein [Flavobacterium seoulense]|uniref:Uncharacterized protein n=1 Tax=Flavobacterium seoulense TaxID=1492738 RepID=A0A066WMQ3_9FLAO|nr:hypothetical protein [Flavobacterium seoulense]KDN55151.1 hypothetical protein FEM21_17420 [Flavobacterium seoulense]